MNEAEWLAATDPTPMLEALRASGKASERKLRLFACACVRRVWPLLTDERSRNAVEVAEQIVDGQPGPADRARADAFAAAAGARAPAAATAAAVLQLGAIWGHSTAGHLAARQAVLAAAVAVKNDARTGKAAPRPSAKRERAVQCELVRCIFGNPFRPLPPLPSSLLIWRDGLMVKLAEAAYEYRILPAGYLEPARLAVLGDALEEAGSTDAELLGHLRGPGPHVRGCHAVDLLLARS